MPIYEYHCEGCSTDFEYLVLGQDGPGSCPTCNSKKLEKIMSPCGFVSKGNGGATVSSSAGSSCGGCSASSCAGCG